MKQKTIEIPAEAMRPVIDEVSKKIVEEKLAEKRQGKSTHERLYELNKELQQKKLQKRQEENEKFRQLSVAHDPNHTMNVTLKREKPLD